MKKYLNSAAIIITGLLIITGSHCSKKTDATPNTCKTCQALGTGPDQPVISKQVCTAAEEQAFRSANAGKEITCRQ